MRRMKLLYKRGAGMEGTDFACVWVVYFISVSFGGVGMWRAKMYCRRIVWKDSSMALSDGFCAYMVVFHIELG